MEKTQLTKQIELYSNSIVTFFVLQGLAYCYYFGTNEFFNNLVKTSQGLSASLVLISVVTVLLGLIANTFLGKQVGDMTGVEYSDLVKKLYLGKSFIIFVFGVLPTVVTIKYSIL